MKTTFRKFLAFGFVVLLSFVCLNQTSYALSCKDSQGIDGPSASDECWTQVRVSPNLTEVVSAYSVLTYDFTRADTADRGAIWVRPARASADWFKIAGVSQSIIATGDYGLVLVRGRGKINLTGEAATSGDPLYASSRSGFAGNSAALGTGPTVVSSDPIAIVLQTSTAVAQATIDAYIIVR